MKKNTYLTSISLIAFFFICVVACDKDFRNVESDILNSSVATNFEIISGDEGVIVYTNNLGIPETVKAVQTNNLTVTGLGIYEDAFGQATSSFVSQLSPITFSPTFKENDTDEIVLDSVVLTVPYFNTVTGIDEDGNFEYQLDSVYGNQANLKLSLFESGYFIRDFDPNGDFEDSQPFFSNMTESSASDMIDGLENTSIQYFTEINETSGPIYLERFPINNNSIRLTEISEEGDTITTQNLAPSIRLKLDTNYWQTKIIDQEGNDVLSSQNNFSEFFRGLYFKAEMPDDDDDKNYMILNFGSTNANITLHYTRREFVIDNDGNVTTEVESETQNTYILNFGPRTINFFNNDFTGISLPTPDSINGDERVYLKGGEGAIAKIKLFNGDDVDDNDLTNNSFEEWKNQFVITDENGGFVESKRLVNEANLVFHVDDATLGTPNSNHIEPQRLYIYDAENNTPLIDYFLDLSNNIEPQFSRNNHLVPLEREETMDDSQGKGIKYKIRITEHINNLLLRDSTNVELGLSVSLNPNLEEINTQRQIQTQNNMEELLPISSVVSPMGTVLYGNATSDETKRVYLEIFYTCLLDEESCENNN